MVTTFSLGRGSLRSHGIFRTLEKEPPHARNRTATKKIFSFPSSFFSFSVTPYWNSNRRQIITTIIIKITVAMIIEVDMHPFRFSDEIIHTRVNVIPPMEKEAD